MQKTQSDNEEKAFEDKEEALIEDALIAASPWILFAQLGKPGPVDAAMRGLVRKQLRKRQRQRLEFVVHGALQLALVGLRMGLPKDMRRMLFSLALQVAK